EEFKLGEVVDLVIEKKIEKVAVVGFGFAEPHLVYVVHPTEPLKHFQLLVDRSLLKKQPEKTPPKKSDMSDLLDLV
ncbi:MAG TPA: hypothetical protein VGB63_18510, partial [Pedobacter sp.]